MFDALVPWYPWVKSLHLISVFAWMAGLFYLPRLYVYHMQVPPRDPRSELFKVMERRLLKAIINPAMVVTWILGLTLVWLGNWYLSPWMHAKFALVIILSGLHGILVRRWREFADDRNTRSQKYYRIINEVPAVLMVGIVILVVLKPF